MKMNNEAHQTPYFEPCSNVIKCGKHYIMCEKLKICVMTCKILLTPNFWNSYIKKTIMFSSSKTKYGVGLSQKHVTFQKVDSSVTSNNSILLELCCGRPDDFKSVILPPFSSALAFISSWEYLDLQLLNTAGLLSLSLLQLKRLMRAVELNHHSKVEVWKPKQWAGRQWNES